MKIRVSSSATPRHPHFNARNQSSKEIEREKEREGCDILEKVKLRGPGNENEYRKVSAYLLMMEEAKSSLCVQLI